MRLVFAGKILSLMGVSSCPDEWSGFCKLTDDPADIVIKLIIDNSKSPNKNMGIYHYGNLSNICIDRSTSDYLLSDDGWKNCELHVASVRSVQKSRLCFAAVQAALMPERLVFIHAALVEWEDKGILFIGPSGIGKSTQADLWARFESATIINGDVALIKADGKNFYGIGTPWHGNSPHCLDRSVPLSAIIVLEQACDNCLERMAARAMVENMFNNMFIPLMLEDANEIALDFLDGLLKNIPIYLLRNRADKGSVDILKEELRKLGKGVQANSHGFSSAKCIP